jgi:nucleoside-diphosphate-sugar epimerase
MKNILVVGGAGYVGGAVTDLLLDSDYDVRVYDKIIYEDSYRKPVDFVFGDVREYEKLKPCLDWADAVVLLAAIVGDGACQLDPEETKSVNQDSVNK